jgi:hypothetical protein
VGVMKCDRFFCFTPPPTPSRRGEGSRAQPPKLSYAIALPWGDELGAMFFSWCECDLDLQNLLEHLSPYAPPTPNPSPVDAKHRFAMMGEGDARW